MFSGLPDLAAWSRAITRSLSMSFCVTSSRRTKRGFVALEAPDGDVLADLRNDRLRLLRDRLSVPRLARELLDSFRFALGDPLGDVVSELAELVRARDEVGLAIDLHEHSDVAARVRLHCAFGRDSSGLLGGRGEAFLAEDSARLLHVSTGLGERALDVHHARAGLFAQLFHHRCGDFSHCCSPEECDYDATGAGSAATGSAAIGAGASAALSSVPT